MLQIIKEKTLIAILQITRNCLAIILTDYRYLGKLPALI